MLMYLQRKAIWERMNEEIEEMVGLAEIKLQLQEISDQIKEAEMYTFLGKRVVPPRPFHMTFIGNNTTGKSTVVEVLAKAFFLARSLDFHTVIETDYWGRNSEDIHLATGGVLFIDVDRLAYNETEIVPDAANELKYVMDAGETSVIFGGTKSNVNRFINSIRSLYGRLSITLSFEGLTFKDMAMILRIKVADESKSEDNIMRGINLDEEGCTIEDIANMLEREVTREVMGAMNRYLVDSMLVAAKHNLEIRMEGVPESDAKTTLALEDLEAGVQIVQLNHKAILLD